MNEKTPKLLSGKPHKISGHQNRLSIKNQKNTRLHV
jgi:hypothetical protein